MITLIRNREHLSIVRSIDYVMRFAYNKNKYIKSFIRCRNDSYLTSETYVICLRSRCHQRTPSPSHDCRDTGHPYHSWLSVETHNSHLHRSIRSYQYHRSLILIHTHTHTHTRHTVVHTNATYLNIWMTHYTLCIMRVAHTF